MHDLLLFSCIDSLFNDPLCIYLYLIVTSKDILETLVLGDLRTLFNPTATGHHHLAVEVCE